MGNLFLFPAPAPTYTADSEIVRDFLVWIDETAIMPPQRRKRVSSGSSVYSDPTSSSHVRFPALWLPGNSPHTLLYFHGNSTDLGDMADELLSLRDYLQCNLLALEYPGYGLCADLPVTPAGIDKWSRASFNWLVDKGLSPESIVLFGRSIGTGPAVKLGASLKADGVEVGGIILHSPYLSVHKIASVHAGSIGPWVIGNYWDTETSLAAMAPNAPLLIIHGRNDGIIPVEHGEQLLNDYRGVVKTGWFPDDSPHNAYDVEADLGVPISKFLSTESRSRFERRASVKITTHDRGLARPFLRPAPSPTRDPQVKHYLVPQRITSLSSGVQKRVLRRFPSLGQNNLCTKSPGGINESIELNRSKSAVSFRQSSCL